MRRFDLPPTNHPLPRRPLRRRPRAGFTLIEMMVTLVIMGILLGMSVFRLDTARYVADANVRLVRYALQHAQRLSLEQQRDVIVSFDTVTGRIRVGLDRDNSKTITGNEPRIWRTLEEGARFTKPSVGVTGTVAAAVTGSNLKIIDGFQSLTFHRDGSASSTLEVYLRVTGHSKPAQRAVTLVQSTARTDWFQKSTGSWTKGGF
jgi:prepilin-type N-terminal cleavage/methylation domain-containing protein